MRVDLLTERTEEIRRLAHDHGVTSLKVFGSYASGAAIDSSDLDLLVQLEPERDLLDLVSFKLAVEDLLGCEVDVVTEGGLSPYLRDHIMREAKPL